MMTMPEWSDNQIMVAGLILIGVMFVCFVAAAWAKVINE